MLVDKIKSVRSFLATHWTFVVVETESGLQGFGESSYYLHPIAGKAAIDEIGEALVGHDAMRPEWHFNRFLKHHALRDSVQMAALSAIDQALWDIKGKALGVPVWHLLGGRVRDKVRAILLVEAGSREEIVEKAKSAVAEGFTALKIKPFVGDWSTKSNASTLKMAADTFGEVREAIGWDVDLAVEIHRNLSPADAVTFTQLIRDYLPYFVEDPIMPFSVSENARTAAAMAGPTALAERNLNIWEFREYSDAEGINIIRPDAGLAGGFTQLRKIAAIAESRHQRIVPHNFTSPVLTACHIQLAACTSNWDVQGYVREQRQPWTDVVKNINKLENGFLMIPETPGIGIELDMDYMENEAKYTPFGTAFNHQERVAMDGGLKLV